MRRESKEAERKSDRKEPKKKHGNNKHEAMETNCVHPIALVICDQPGPGLARKTRTAVRTTYMCVLWIIYKLFPTNSFSNTQ